MNVMHRKSDLLLFKIDFLIVLVLFLSFFFPDICSACTIVIKANDKLILVGNNEDFIEPRTKVWFYPSTRKDYGRVIWGFDRYLFPYQGGMNDHGLFVDINAIGFSGWQDDPEKPNFEGDEIEYILTHFASIEEVIKFFQQNDIALDYVKFVVADAQGKSVILEWLNNKLHIIHRKGNYQISTNYLSPKEHTEPRYQIAEQILKNQGKPTVALIRKVLSATSYDVYFGQTLYSTICDLKQKKVYLYHFHNFEEVVTFNLDKELEKGEASYAIPSLFKISPHSEYWFKRLGSQLGAKDLMSVIEEKGIDEGIKTFHAMKEKKITFNQYDFPEWMMRSLGLNYLKKNQTDKAIAIFKLNIQQNPKSWQVYYDLAEAYMKNGDKKLAVRNYKKALKLNPMERKTQERLNQLKK
jgi:penicillin V acylase-like amidase (Ntn superfamily)